MFRAQGSRPSRHGSDVAVGDRVAVRNRFDSSWVDGFEVVDEVDAERRIYRVRRCCDAVVLPATFTPDQMRPSAPDPAADWGTWVR